MQPGRSQIGTNIEICIMFTRDRNEIIPGDFVSVIIVSIVDIYMRRGCNSSDQSEVIPPAEPNQISTIIMTRSASNSVMMNEDPIS